MKFSQIEFEDRRMRLAAQLLAIDEESLLEVFEKLIAAATFKNPKILLTKEELQLRLDQALRDAKDGETIEPDALISEIDSWGSLS